MRIEVKPGANKPNKLAKDKLCVTVLHFSGYPHTGGTLLSCQILLASVFAITLTGASVLSEPVVSYSEQIKIGAVHTIYPQRLECEL